MKLAPGAFYLAAAIALEVAGTLCLKSASASRWSAALFALTLCLYAGAFYGLSLALRTIPVGVAYAVWSGAGTVLIALIGWAVFRQTLDMRSLIGILLVVMGIIVMSSRAHDGARPSAITNARSLS